MSVVLLRSEAIATTDGIQQKEEEVKRVKPFSAHAP